MAAPDGARRLRVAELIRRELAGALQDFARANDAGLLSLTQVDVAPDLRSARLGVSAIGGRLDDAELLRRLGESAGDLRTRLARTLALRTVPRLHFELDDRMGEAVRLSSLIREGLPPEHEADSASDDAEP
jgi:ribosome-binding factor A